MLLYSYLTLWKVRKNVCLCLFSVINNWLLRTNLLCIMNALSAFCGRIVRSSVWTPNATLPRWSAKTIWSLFHFRNPLLPSINHPLSVAYLQFLLSYTQTVLKSWNPACISRIILPFFFFLIWFFAALTLSVHSSVSEIYFWLLGQANMLIIFLSPRRLWNTIALIIYIPITLQWEIHYFKLNHLFLVYFCHHLSLMPCIA